MRRNKILWVLTGLLGIGAALPVQAALKVGESFPDLASCQVEGNLSALPPDKVVLVDFWASWCGPCAKSFPVMDELQKTYGARGFVIVAVNEDDKKADMERFLQDHHISFSVVRDARQKLVEKTGISSMPSSFLLDRSGKVIYAHTGFHGNGTLKEYKQEIESLLNSGKK